MDPNNLESRVNCTRRGATNSRLNGIDVNDSATPMLALSTTAINTDSIEEFRFVTSGGKAEYGRNAGAQIELITRSGTSAWLGNAFEYHPGAPVRQITDNLTIVRGKHILKGGTGSEQSKHMQEEQIDNFVCSLDLLSCRKEARNLSPRGAQALA